MERDTFIFRRRWYEALRGLDSNTKAAAFDCICDYALNHNTEESQDPMVRMAMAFIIPDLQEDCEKWLGIKEKRSEAGKRGNEKRWGNKQSQDIANIANATNCSQDIANIAVNVLQDTKVSMCNNNISSLSANASNKDMSDSCEADDAISYEKLIVFWNNAFKNTCISALSSINGTRRSMTKARIKKFGKDKFAEAIDKAAHSAYLTSGEAKWFCYDWFIKPNNFPKVLEGKYSDGQAGSQADKKIPVEYTLDLMKAKERYYDGDRSLVWAGTDNKHMYITTIEVAEKYGLPYKQFAV